MSTFKASGIFASKIFREALAGYAFNVCGLVAGVIIALKSDVLSISSWTVAVYPAILSARGIIGGLFTGRLSTALHLGTIFPRVSENTKNFRMLFKALITLTFEMGVIMSLFSMFFGSLFWRAALLDFPKILSVILATMALGLFIAFITIGFSFVSFRYGLNSDVFLYPAVSALSDILITSSYILVLSLFFSPNPLGPWVVVALALLLTILALHNLVRNFGEEVYTKTLKESFVTLMLVAIIVNFTGSFLKAINVHVRMTGESEVLVVYPAVIAIIGSMGAIVGSTATTKLAVGLLGTSFSEIRHHIGEILSSWIASILVFILLSFLTLSLSGKFSLPLFGRFALTLLITNVTAAIAIVFVSFGIAILTFQRGLDPDNFVIPIESVLADGVTSVSLLMALFLVA